MWKQFISIRLKTHTRKQIYIIYIKIPNILRKILRNNYINSRFLSNFGRFFPQFSPTFTLDLRIFLCSCFFLMIFRMICEFSDDIHTFILFACQIEINEHLMMRDTLWLENHSLYHFSCHRFEWKYIKKYGDCVFRSNFWWL